VPIGTQVIPTTIWDAHQLIAFGLKRNGIVDPDGRSNLPWGMGAAVSGPETGCAWSFSKDIWDSTPGSDPDRMKKAIEMGPWKRIQYPGSEASRDTPGRRGTTTDRVGMNASNLGFALSPENPLPPTESWNDGVSPNALRFSWGGLEKGRADFARVQLKILKNPGESGSPFDEQGFLQLMGDAFGGGRRRQQRQPGPPVALLQALRHRPQLHAVFSISCRLDLCLTGLWTVS
jgi:hypothetical protein